MTEELDPSRILKDNDFIWYMGEKYEKVKPPELKTLYQMLDDEKYYPDRCDNICEIVKEWMSQYSCETNKWDEDYKCGYMDAIDTLKKGL